MKFDAKASMMGSATPTEKSKVRSKSSKNKDLKKKKVARELSSNKLNKIKL